MYLLYDFDSTSSNYQYDEIDISSFKNMITGVQFANNIYFAMTNSNYYYISHDGVKWVEHDLFGNYIGLELFSTDDYFVGIVVDENSKTMYFYTEDGKNFIYYDFESEYGNDMSIITTPLSTFISKYDNYITELMFYDRSIMLSSTGSVKTHSSQISPKKTKFYKGHYNVSDNLINEIQLDFTPRMVIIRSITKSDSEPFEEVVISNSKELYQTFNDDINKSTNGIMIDKNGSEIIINEANESRIIPNGFIHKANHTGMYIYFAFN